MRDAERAQWSVQQMRSDSHHDLLGFGSFLVVGDVDLVLDGANDSLIQPLGAARSLLDAMTRDLLQPILQLLQPVWD